MEFILGAATHSHKKILTTCAPYGSNFVAALSAQAARLGLKAVIFHFFGPSNPQTQAHALYSKSVGAKLNLHSGSLLRSIAQAYPHAWMAQAREQKERITIAEGGSSPLGALGHAGAYFELIEQIKRREIPLPHAIVVGAGTCGTIAGLLAASRIADLSIPILGVRTVPRLLCNATKIAALANQVLALLGASGQILPREIWLEAAPNQGTRYGIPTPQGHRIKKEVLELEGLHLDTTYTTKVVEKIEQDLVLGHYRKLGIQRLLYWHTYSPIAELKHLEVVSEHGHSTVSLPRNFRAPSRPFRNPVPAFDQGLCFDVPGGRTNVP